MNLCELKEGQKGFISKVKGRGAFRKRIIEMGFVKGQEVEVVKNAPLRDPIEYRIMDYLVSLRRSESRLIQVVSERELVEDENGVEFNGVIDTEKLKKKLG